VNKSTIPETPLPFCQFWDLGVKFNNDQENITSSPNGKCQVVESLLPISTSERASRKESLPKGKLQLCNLIFCIQ
jgi:hypothetical protein